MRLQEVFGRPPAEARRVLNALVHPEVIGATKAFIQANDEWSRCLHYAHPWSCSKEAEARYENIKYGWLGGGAGIGFDEGWCENCRKKAMS